MTDEREIPPNLHLFSLEDNFHPVDAERVVELVAGFDAACRKINPYWGQQPLSELSFSSPAGEVNIIRAQASNAFGLKVGITKSGVGCAVLTVDSSQELWDIRYGVDNGGGNRCVGADFTNTLRCVQEGRRILGLVVREARRRQVLSSV